jgi:hypothetical protein
MSARFNNEIPDGALCAYSIITHLVIEILAAEVKIAVPDCIFVGYPFLFRPLGTGMCLYCS